MGSSWEEGRWTECHRQHPLLQQVLGPGFRIANPFKPHAVAKLQLIKRFAAAAVFAQSGIVNHE
jgi:hypothetical protein